MSETPSDPSPQDAQPAWRKAIDNPWLMLAILFFVTAFLGIPFLWMSRGFTTFWKVVITVAVLLWTALIFWVFWLIMVWCYVRVRDAVCPAAFLALSAAVAWRSGQQFRIARF